MATAAETRTDRLVVLMSPSEKRRLAEQAQGVGMSVSDFVRAATDAYATASNDDVPEEAIEEFARWVEEAREKMRAALDRLEAYRAQAQQVDEAAVRQRVIDELGSRTDIDWDRLSDFLGGRQ